jgi:hypothetical protein
MLEGLLLSGKGFFSRKFNLIWKAKVTKSNRLLFQLQPLELGISEKECGSLQEEHPTPTASMIPSEGSIGMYRRLVDQGKLTVQEAEQMLGGSLNPARMDKWFPTPTASEVRQGYQDRTKGKKGTQKSLSTEIIDSEGGRHATKAQLNAEWVTWMMGYPRDYLTISKENLKEFQDWQKNKNTDQEN